METFSHNLFSGNQTTLNHPIVAKFRSQFNETLFNRRVPAHHKNICTTFLNGNRLLRNGDSSSYTAFSEMVVTDRTESPLSGISNKNTFKRKQVFYDLVDEYWNEDFWRNYNIIEPTESLENAVSKLRKQSN